MAVIIPFRHEKNIIIHMIRSRYEASNLDFCVNPGKNRFIVGYENMKNANIAEISNIIV